MSRIAKETGIGRATLYKYFPDLESVLAAWHERQVADHLRHLTEVRDQAGTPGERLQAVLRAYALIKSAHPHGTELAALLHRGEHVTRAHQHLSDLGRRARRTRALLRPRTRARRTASRRRQQWSASSQSP